MNWMPLTVMLPPQQHRDGNCSSQFWWWIMGSCRRIFVRIRNDLGVWFDDDDDDNERRDEDNDGIPAVVRGLKSCFKMNCRFEIVRKFDPFTS